MNAGRFAVGSVVVAGLITGGAAIAADRKPGARVIIGATVAAVMLSAVAPLAPSLVVALSAVIILATILGPGYSLIRPLAALVS